MREARADWVGFCDDDDLWAPRKLRTQLDALEGSDALFCYGPALMLDADRSVVVPDQPAPAPEDLATRLAEGNVLPGGCSNVVMRTDIARELGGFDERLSMVADWDLWLRLANRGRAVTYPDVLVAYRWHGRNMTAQAAFARREREFAYFVEKHGADGRRRLRPTGYSRWLAAQAPTRRAAAMVHLRTGLAARSPGSLLRAATVVLGARRLRDAFARLRRRSAPEPRASDDPTVRAPDWLEPHRAATERSP
jgi:glycosyltransferase involved in cell wall biosynthesis